MNDNQAKYPQLRFKGFTDPWEERKLGEVATLSSSKRIHSSDYVTEGIPFYRGSEISTGGITGNQELFISKEKFDEIKEKYGVPSVGDLLVTAVGTLGNLWKVDSRRFYYKDGNLIQISKMQVNSDYLLTYFTGGIGKKRLLDSAAGSNQKALTMVKMREITVDFPSEDEQQKIGSFFKQLDDTIALHQRKLAKLKELKQGYLQKLFPKNGAKVPELRFAGFADAWEQRKLGEVATFLNGRAYKQDELLDSGKYKVLRVGNFYTNDSWYYSNMELGDKYYVDKGDLVYTWSATFGPHIWSGEKVIYHYHIWKVELSKFLDRNFTLQLLEADKARLLSSTNGSTMIHVTKGDMESKIVSIPNIDEQKQIGSFFKQLDNTITLYQRKLKKIQELKKGYLQKMFC
ncbi:restriction endonuclease subunit S [Secundilactobacillus muriivasis]